MLTLTPPPQSGVWSAMSGLAHDLRQPLSVIEACADYLNLVLPPTDHRARQQLQLLEQQVGEANRILHEALLKLHYSDEPAEPAAQPATSRPLTKAASAAVTY
jgi:signal transduction histidine kinase